MLLSASALSFSYGQLSILNDVNLKLHPGEWLTIVGPNGAGKTTLMRCMLGLLRVRQGDVQIRGRSLRSLARREIARQIALLPQQGFLPFGFSVREVVAMGRTPYVGRFRPLTSTDHDIIDRALDDTETASLSDRPVTALSGGEMQRVFLARALAQDTPILALDEPTTNLDLFHERTLLDQVLQRKKEGAAILAVLHDLNLAARYSDRVLILSAGMVAAAGPPAEVLSAENIENIFRVKAQVWRDESTNKIGIIA